MATTQNTPSVASSAGLGAGRMTRDEAWKAAENAGMPVMEMDFSHFPIFRGEPGNDGFHCDECGLWTSENQRARTHTDTYHICQGCAACA